MIKARGKTGLGQDLLFIGLSGENVTRLMSDEPITFNAAELGLPPMQIVIVGGRSEDDITADLRRHGVRVHE